MDSASSANSVLGSANSANKVASSANCASGKAVVKYIDITCIWYVQGKLMILETRPFFPVRCIVDHSLNMSPM